MNLISDLSFSGLIISYLVSIGERERDIIKQSKLDKEEDEEDGDADNEGL